MITFKTHKIVLGTLVFGLTVPTAFAYATFRTFALNLITILNSAAVFIMGLALVFFIIGVVRFMLSAGNEQGRSQGKQLIIWGTVVLFVMVSVWGIVGIINNTFFG